MAGMKKATLPGVLFTIAFAAFMGCAVHFLFFPKLFSGPGDIAGNHKQVLKRLGRISEAQTAYWEYIRKETGRGRFARFYAHLWIHVDDAGRRHPLNLIDRRTALAMTRENAVDGYYFIDLLRRHRKHGNTTIPVDHEREWMVAAFPVRLNETGTCTFLADQSGGIFAKKLPRPPGTGPADPTAAGWTLLSDGVPPFP